MKSRNQILLESKIRKMVREELANTIDPQVLDAVKTISMYSGWITDPNRKNSNEDLIKYVDLVRNSIEKIEKLIK